MFNLKSNYYKIIKETSISNFMKILNFNLNYLQKNNI